MLAFNRRGSPYTEDIFHVERSSRLSVSKSLTRGCCNILSPSYLCYEMHRGMEDTEERYIVRSSAAFFLSDKMSGEMAVCKPVKMRRNDMRALFA